MGAIFFVVHKGVVLYKCVKYVTDIRFYSILELWDASNELNCFCNIK